GEHNTDFHPMVDFLEASPLSNIATALVCLATNRTYNFSKMIFDGLVKNVNNKHSSAIFLAVALLFFWQWEPTSLVVGSCSEQLAREDQRRAEQIARDAEIARIHAEEELQSMIEGLDSNTETVAKYLEEYHQFSSELPMERRIELISDLVKYQNNYSKVYKFQSQQRKSWTKKQKRDYYMAVIRNNLGWKVKDFKGMTFEELQAKFNSVYKKMEDFIPMGLKEEAERIKRKGINLEQESAK
nr:hypothetical protein [Tanacetum cinerariifolium]